MQCKHCEFRILLAVFIPGGNDGIPKFLDLRGIGPDLDLSGKASMIVMILSDDAEMGPRSRFDGTGDIGVRFRVEPDGIGRRIGMRGHGLHVHVSTVNPEHSGMDIVDLIPQLSCGMFPCFGETCHGHSFRFERSRIETSASPLCSRWSLRSKKRSRRKPRTLVGCEFLPPLFP
jgi:hypothetical protein